jgi:hypothetical protein
MRAGVANHYPETTFHTVSLGNSVHKRKPGFIADSSSPAIRSQAQLLRLYTAMIGKEGKR